MLARCACGAARMATRPSSKERSERRASILAEALTAGREALRRQATRHARLTADAEEALQEACVEFLRYYDGEPGEHALRYLMLCVKQRAWALTRRSAHESAEGIELTTTDALESGKTLIAVLCERPGPAERAARDEDAARFLAALAALKPDERRALLLAGLGCSYREIGAIQGWTYTKVNRCLAEGRAALRRGQRAK
jgi:RNA polymerase sigma factor (sigma-70 family)